MDLNEMLEKMNWKKIAITIVIALFVMCLIREIFFWTYFHEATRMFAQFNNQFDHQQKEMHNKLTEAENDFDRRHKAFNEMFDKAHQAIEESSNQFKNTMAELDRQALEREKKFDAVFAKAPQQMFKQHKAMSEKMFNEFKKEIKSR